LLGISSYADECGTLESGGRPHEKQQVARQG
jgi:hypothetical protein